MNYLSPSLLSADFSKLADDIKIIEDGGAQMAHLDIMDGHFVPNISFGSAIVKSLRKHSNLIFDVHLMIEYPEQYIPCFIEAGSDIITVHYESTHHVHRALQQIKNAGIKAGVALNPGTPVEVIYDLLGELDMVLIMSVNPGFGGQSFIEFSKDKIKKLRNEIERRNLQVDIQVDGGVNLNNVEEIVECGANVIVAGSAIYKSENVIETTKQFLERMQ